MSQHYHNFHIVSVSPWPAFASLAGLVFTMSSVGYFQGYAYSELGSLLGLIMILLTMIVWWRDVIREASYQGIHTAEVETGIKIGVILFIVSEAMLFFSFFWAYFHNSLSPSVELGGVWPPVGIEVLNAFQIPLLNTVILLTSGATVTWAHHALISQNRKDTIKGLFFTIVLGLIFTAFQGLEYVEAPFSIADSVFGSAFFMTTGLHGLHVIVGALFLLVCFFRLLEYHFTPNHHIGLESAILYWHFVDYVWLFVFAVYYIWAS